MTIAYEPSNFTDYLPYVGQPQTLRILLSAHDEHDSAVMIHIDNTTSSLPLLQSGNQYPHTTISDTSADVNNMYSAKYSNSLWQRIYSTGLLNITYDSTTGKPEYISFNTSMTDNDVYKTILPPATGFGDKYDSTKVTVMTTDALTTPLIFTGTVCLSSYWNNVTLQCEIPNELLIPIIAME